MIIPRNLLIVKKFLMNLKMLINLMILLLPEQMMKIIKTKVNLHTNKWMEKVIMFSYYINVFQPVKMMIKMF